MKETPRVRITFDRSRRRIHGTFAHELRALLRYGSVAGSFEAERITRPCGRATSRSRPIASPSLLKQQELTDGFHQRNDRP